MYKNINYSLCQTLTVSLIFDGMFCHENEMFLSDEKQRFFSARQTKNQLLESYSYNICRDGTNRK